MYNARKSLVYDKPAKMWVEALPIGNGSFGGMVYGGIAQDQIEFNIDTLWSGDGRSKSNPSPDKNFEEVIQLLQDKSYSQAEQHLKENILGDWSESYLPLGSVTLEQNGVEEVDNYERILDLDSGIVRTRYTSQGVTYTKEVLCSHPDQVMVMKISATKPVIDVKVFLNSQIVAKSVEECPDDYLGLQGTAPIYVAPNYFKCENPIRYSKGKGTQFELGMQVVTNKGQVDKIGQALHITQTDEILLYFGASTDFDKDCKKLIQRATDIDYESLKIKHLEEYQNYFNRVDLELGEERTSLTTDKRIEQFSKDEEDLALIALIFNYGRYLLISSSRPGTIAANLQGIWNNKLRAPWSSNYTLNINTEMNYWLAEVTNLSECHKPLFSLITKMSKEGKKVAKELYGLDGWVAHHNTDIWGHASPVGREEQNCSLVTYGFWPMSSGWLCDHLWEHYLFTGDKRFLQEEAYPLMKEAIRFYLGYLRPYKQYLVTIPSTSPENTFIGEDGAPHALTLGATMDIGILKNLFENFENLCKELELQDDLLPQIASVKKQLPPYKIGKHGQLQEWLTDFEDHDPHHRHVSHLYGLYPASHIHPVDTPELSKACEVTLEQRGDEGTGWSLAWKVNLWARLGKGDRAFELIKQQLRLTHEEEVSTVGGGTYPNLFCAHPPFQIDGNFGITAGISEMLLQSHRDKIELLPALPNSWKDGKITGLRARGGFTLSFNWEKHKIKQVSIQSDRDTTCHLIVNGKEKIIECKANKPTLYFE